MLILKNAIKSLYFCSKKCMDSLTLKCHNLSWHGVGAPQKLSWWQIYETQKIEVFRMSVFLNSI